MGTILSLFFWYKDRRAAVHEMILFARWNIGIRAQYALPFWTTPHLFSSHENVIVSFRIFQLLITLNFSV